MRRTAMLLALIVGLGWSSRAGSATPGDPNEGARVYRACVACHSLAPGQHRTGPSLAGVLGRKAGAAPGFTRYSPALERADIIWDAATLDAWLADPQTMIPGNRMIFPGLPDEQARADLIAYLEEATAEGSDAARGERPAARVAA